MKVRKHRQTRPPWQVRERAIALLERLIAPHDDVRHDVRLPVIGSAKQRTRQCDVVIYSGTFPRQTITIVEVQKRHRRVGLHDLGGWLLKMREVGAHSLIAVSETGFADSVIESAKAEGGRVRLVTLDTSAAREKPFPTDPDLHVFDRKVEVVEFGAMRLVGADPAKGSAGRKFSRDEKRFSLGNGQVAELTLSDLVSRVSNEVFADFSEPYALVEADFGALDLELWFHDAGSSREVEHWPLTLVITTTERKVPLDLESAAYRQEGEARPLAWLSQATWKEDDKDLRVSFAVRKLANGGVIVTVDEDGLSGRGFVKAECRSAPRVDGTGDSA